MPTPSMEDYLEKIYQLIDKKGYARATDIANALDVNPSSVTKMIQKLDKEQYVVYEKYRGLKLTSKGEKIGKKLVHRHKILEKFLHLIGVKDEESIYLEVEGIEHHLGQRSISSIELLVNFFEHNPDVKKRFKEYCYNYRDLVK
ncbi:manganese transport transcriptional regulator [Vulcanibacillus modesticaldus]|uniref:Manganese transport regulator n=1 Tax=Vulcanibacillus modesticaldus TaxID=337097 RepID=A0A1D2YU95_9BACI|nr:transcriptional regulator MntR [Vulcanibacillus modesticaldus]OEF99215.1 manganese transport transcriptional regulator [Vulcanibacillus modesticaldus]